MLRLSMKEISKNTLLSLFVMLQSVFLLIVLIASTSIIASRYDRLRAVRSIVGDQGLVMRATHIFVNEEDAVIENETCSSAEHMEAVFQGAEAFCTYSVWASYKINGYEFEPSTISYDSEVAFAYTPNMKEGRWLEKSDLSSAAVEAVITEDVEGVQVGDILELVSPWTSASMEVVVVGVLADYEYVLGDVLQSGAEYGDVRDCFMFHSTEYGLDSMFFILEEDLRSSEIEQFGEYCFTTMVQGLEFIKYNDDITGQQKENIQATVSSSQCNLNMCLDVEDMITASRAYIWEQIDELIPIFIGLLMFSVLSFICSGFIMTRLQLKNYSLYYITGMTWKKCVLVRILSQALQLVFSFLIVLIMYQVCNVSGVLDDTVFSLGIIQIAACGIYMLLCLGISAAIPFSIMRNHTPKEILISSSTYI